MANCFPAIVISEGKLENALKGTEGQTFDKINASIANRKPGYLVVLIVDTLKENGWTADAIHFLGVEIINESGIL